MLRSKKAKRSTSFHLKLWAKKSICSLSLRPVSKERLKLFKLILLDLDLEFDQKKKELWHIDTYTPQHFILMNKMRKWSVSWICVYHYEEKKDLDLELPEGLGLGALKPWVFRFILTNLFLLPYISREFCWGRLNSHLFKFWKICYSRIFVIF